MNIGQNEDWQSLNDSTMESTVAMVIGMVSGAHRKMLGRLLEKTTEEDYWRRVLAKTIEAASTASWMRIRRVAYLWSAFRSAFCRLAARRTAARSHRRLLPEATADAATTCQTGRSRSGSAYECTPLVPVAISPVDSRLGWCPTVPLRLKGREKWR